MSNPNISSRRTTFNKISAESPFTNPAFLPLKSPNFPQSPSKITSQDDDFEIPKPTKKFKSGKSAENGTFTTPPGADWSSSFLPNSAQLDELIRKQAPDFLGNIQLKVVDENWEREALKQIKNSSLHKLLSSDIYGLDAFYAEGAFNGGQQTPLESLNQDEISQLMEKINQDLKQEVPHFSQAQGQFVIPDLPLDLQNALDELVYQTPISPQTEKSPKKEKKRSYIKKTKRANDTHPDQNLVVTNQEQTLEDDNLESPQNTNKKATRKAQLKSKVEKTAVNETENFPPKELLGKRSPPKTDQEPQIQSPPPQRRATRRSQQQTPQNQQPETPPKVPQNKSKKTAKSPPKLEKKNSEEEKVTKKRPSAKENKAEQAAAPISNFDKSSSDDDSLDMPFKNYNKKIAAQNEEDAMEIENPVQRIVNLKIGKAHQINPLPLVLNKERPRRQIKKIIWSPKGIEPKVYEDFIDQFQNIIEKDITNTEVACKTLIKFDMDINKAIENIKKNVAYYKNQMIPGQRVLRTRFSLPS